MTNDWQLAYDDDNEVYTCFEATRENIESFLHSFDGRTRFRCTIGRDSTDSYFACLGEPDKRFIEGLWEGSPFVLRRVGPVGGTPVPVRCGTRPSETFLVDPSEVLTAGEALTVMLSYRERDELPSGYVAEPKSYTIPQFASAP